MKIKFISGILCLAALFTGCQQKQTTGYTIDGTLKGARNGATVKLIDAYSDGETNTPLANAVIKNEKFTLKGNMEHPSFCRLIVNLTEPGKEENEDTLLSDELYVENASIQWDADAATLTSLYYNPERTGKATITGSAQQAIYEKYLADQKALLDKMHELGGKYMEEYYTPLVDDPNADVIEKGIELAGEIEHLKKQQLQKTLSYIKEHPETRVAFDQAKNLFQGMYVEVTVKQIDEIVAAIEPAWGKTPFFGDFKDKAERSKLMAVGEKIPDHDFLTPDGKTVKLSSVIPKGKYVLLDFWASWCGPCRGGIPHLKNVMKKYPDFNIVCISIDEDNDEWHKALKEEKMPWTQLHFPPEVTEKGEMGGYAISKIYGITGVPAYILLDGEGRIFMPGAEWAHLDKFLKETYGK